MIDFTPVQKKEQTLLEFSAGMTVEDLKKYTNEMVDAMLAEIADCADKDVIFVPDDPEAEDRYAAEETDRGISWTLGHVVVHTTASSEESAALAAEMARGVDRDGRSRSEIPWQTVTTIEQCRHRLEESRRMRLASLAMWPDTPYLDLIKQSRPDGPQINCVVRFLLGLLHDDDHLGQIKKIVAQAKAVQPA